MLRRILSLFGVGLLISPSLLHADTITTFALDGFTFQSPATLTGTITIDVTTGIPTGINATYTAGSLTDEFTAVRTTFLPPFLFGYPTMGSISVPANNFLQISFPTSTLVGYSGGPVCTYPAGKNCPIVPIGDTEPMGWVLSEFSTLTMEINDIQSGTLDPIPTTTTPEPSTFVLLGSGLIGTLFLNGAFCRKFSLVTF